jgi:hypothetical protein
METRKVASVESDNGSIRASELGASSAGRDCGGTRRMVTERHGAAKHRTAQLSSRSNSSATTATKVIKAPHAISSAFTAPC